MTSKELNEMYATPYTGENANKTHFPMKGFNDVAIETYGEFTRKGTESFIKYFKEHLNKESVFYDLGSGLGKMVIHIGEATEVKKSVGIEYSRERHLVAFKLKETFASKNNRISLINSDIFKQNLSDATIVYFDNTCYSNEGCTQIYNALPPGCIITYKRFFRNIPLSEQVHIKDYDFDRTYFQKSLYMYTKADK